MKGKRKERRYDRGKRVKRRKISYGLGKRGVEKVYKKRKIPSKGNTLQTRRKAR